MENDQREKREWKQFTHNSMRERGKTGYISVSLDLIASMLVARFNSINKQEK